MVVVVVVVVVASAKGLRCRCEKVESRNNGAGGMLSSRALHLKVENDDAKGAKVEVCGLVGLMK